MLEIKFQMALAPLSSQLLHSVPPQCLSEDECCVGANCSDTQEPFEIDFVALFKAWAAEKKNQEKVRYQGNEI